MEDNPEIEGSPERTSHEINYKIYGDDLQFVEIGLDPEETVVAEAGAMMYMENGIAFETKMGDGSDPDQGTWKKIKSAGKRVLAQESLFLTHFTNLSPYHLNVSFGGEFPGTILPLDLTQHNGRVICQKDAFLCASYGTKLDIAFNKKLGSGFFGGEGFILQSLEGDGMSFISVGGSVIEKQVEETGKILVDTGCLVAMESTVDYSIERAGNLKSILFGGEGIFLASLTGTGKVWLQSLPFSRLANRIINSATNLGGQSKGEGSLLGSLAGFGGR